MLDIIGDIHGHADELKALLRKMDYQETSDGWAHPERTVLFLGDYIDRGPKIPETVQIVRSMVESGNAIAIMGNHEYNAICYNTPDGNGGHLRPRTPKNKKQHAATLDQFADDITAYHDMIDWFKVLPMWHETSSLRAVHAYWSNKNINSIRQQLPNALLTEQHLMKSAIPDTPEYASIDATLKGKETAMPAGTSFKDKDGTTRTEIRVKWWLDPEETTIRDLSVIDLGETLPDTLDHNIAFENYSSDEKPVFFGHYWLDGQPHLQTPNVCCLDFSVAKGGVLAGYRFDGEQVLKPENLIYV